MEKQTLFLGSSTQSIWFAQELILRLGNVVNALPWYDPTNWTLTSSTFDALIATIERCDFAVLLLADDDWQQIGDDEPHRATRDNVLFELGLCIGILGRERVLFVYSDEKNFKVPSDLHGITGIKVSFSQEKPLDSQKGDFNLACHRILQHMKEVTSNHGVVGKQARPTLITHARFPDDHDIEVSDLNHLSHEDDSILKIGIRIRDEEVDDVRVYFPSRLNLSHATWTFREDEKGRFYWAARAQVDEMKTRQRSLSFGIKRPRQGAHKLIVTARSKNQERYKKTFVIKVG